MDINRGDIFTEIFSTASSSKGINAYFKREFGECHPNAKLNYRQGDIVTSLLKTKMGKTLVINYDMQLPLPYSNRWMLQGIKGVIMRRKAKSIWLIRVMSIINGSRGNLTKRNIITNGGRLISHHNLMGELI